MKKTVIILLSVILSISMLFGCSNTQPVASVSTAAIEQTATSAPSSTPTISLTPAPTVSATSTPEATQLLEEQEQEPTSETVYITKTGEKYHRDGCQYLSKSQIEISLEDAIAQGYTPCSVCDPPTLGSTEAAVEVTPKPTPEQVIEETPQEEPQTETVYITKTGEKYHRDGCQYLSKSQIPISKDDAIAQGYTPCSRCNP